MSKVYPAQLPAETVVGGYKIVRRISAGGFGIVYLALDETGEKVAIKEYLPTSLATRDAGQLQPQVGADKLPLYRLGLKSFFEEGRSLAQISHDSVANVLDFFRENETVYMVMNYLEGATLQEYIGIARGLKRPKVLRESTIRSLFDELLRGLRVVHQYRMLHLDIKPANVFITDDDRAVLIDFGAARQALTKDAPFIRPMYTPGFAAPELYRRDALIDVRTDIYAVGACIYACMRGFPPDDVPQRRQQDRLEDSLARMAGIYTDNLIHVVRRSMMLKPEARPQTVLELQQKLNMGILQHANKVAAAPSVGTRINKIFGAEGGPKDDSRTTIVQIPRKESP